ncbi:MAG: hypothetical protein A2Y98_03020 [Candidatus Portnoybacteria bacterium RBG_19FT_COMBO_36_7]|uniref:DUF5666 domain-containing protein n=1 Tax=Candidatus Portnoybacteria bacterium RBG_19FT_COMBO_36_7 TaxID=1801992 RepID=A0A1G2F7D5_9BACT|nr:MAG: hypothetical protein A2Y98_03020 [Candidatus Portnoybacteria bacterium RBG_19FT_COMBO_36_7]
MKKTIPIFIAIVILVGAGAFYGGMKYGQNKSSTPQNFQNMTEEERQQLFASGQRAVRMVNRDGQASDRFSNGEIIAKDGQTITVKSQDNSSKIVFYSESTNIQKSTNGTTEDLQIGQQITVSGTDNSDGSIAAQNIQLITNTQQMPPPDRLD